ncbi:MAG: shikimate dehydrogenase [Pseudomonadota bacterium]
MTKLLGVIGNPIAHSLSPLIHNGWLHDAELDAAYEAFHVPDGQFDNALKDLEKKDLFGLNITLPHKGAALAAANEVSEAAGKIGAANTLSLTQDGKWRADNTDAPGFLRSLGNVDPAQDRALILGAGGSARALVFALTNVGVPVTILNRTVEKAEHLAAELGDAKSGYGPIDQATEYIDNATIVINTTSMGHSGEILSLPDGSGRIFYDISYGKIARRQLSHAEARGWQMKDGLGMLVAQAAYSFEIWFGQLPDFDTGLHRCRLALEAAS